MSTVLLVLFAIAVCTSVVGLVWSIIVAVRPHHRRSWRSAAALLGVGLIVSVLSFTGLGAAVQGEGRESAAQQTSTPDPQAASSSKAASERAEAQAAQESSQAQSEQESSLAAQASASSASSASIAAKNSELAQSAASSSAAQAAKESSQAASDSREQAAQSSSAASQSASTSSASQDNQSVVGDSRNHVYYPANQVPSSVPANARTSFANAAAAQAAGYQANGQ